MTHPIVLILFGTLVGVFSGIMGLGGGAIMVPLMVIALGMTQQQAHGTSLAVMIPPVALPAVLRYWKDGNVDWRVALWMAVGVAASSYFGGVIANSVPKETLKWIFGFTLIYIAAYTVFGKEHLTRTLIISGFLVALAMAIFFALRAYDTRNAAVALVTTPTASQQ